MKTGPLLAWLLLIQAAHAAGPQTGAPQPGAPQTGAPQLGGVPPDSLLAAPVNTSLAPTTPVPPPLVQGGVATTSFGSNGMRSSSVELDSGLIGGNSRAFVAVGGGQGPEFHGRPVVSGSSVAAGVSTALPFGTLSVSAGVERDRFSQPY